MKEAILTWLLSNGWQVFATLLLPLLWKYAEKKFKGLSDAQKKSIHALAVLADEQIALYAKNNPKAKWDDFVEPVTEYLVKVTGCTEEVAAKVTTAHLALAKIPLRNLSNTIIDESRTEK